MLAWATPATISGVAVTTHEKNVITRFVDNLNQALDSAYAVAEWPDDTNRSSKDVDAIAVDPAGKRLAIEHTLLQPFEGERYDTNAFLRTIARLDKSPDLVLDGFNVTLSVNVGAVRPGFPWDKVVPAVKEWYLANRASMPVGRTTHAVPGLPAPFQVVVGKSATTGTPHFHVAREMPTDSLPQIVDKALSDKVPKLGAARADVKILLMEVGSLATDFGAAAELIEQLKHKYPGLAVIDSVWTINTVALEDEDYSPSYLIWPLERAYEYDVARNSGA